MELEDPKIISLKRSYQIYNRFLVKELHSQRRRQIFQNDEKFNSFYQRLRKVQGIRIVHSVRDEKFHDIIETVKSKFVCFYCKHHWNLDIIFTGDIPRFVIHLLFTHLDIKFSCKISGDFKLKIDSIRVQGQPSNQERQFYNEKTTPRNFKIIFLEPLKRSFPEELSNLQKKILYFLNFKLISYKKINIP